MPSPIMTLTTLPEELLSQILSHSFPVPPSTRPQWLPHTPTATRLSPLLVSKKLTRIGIPHLYTTLCTPTPSSAHALLHTLTAHPELAAYARTLVAGGAWGPVYSILKMCGALVSLDLCILFSESDECDGDADDQNDDTPFEGLKKMKHLTLRKPNSVYLSLPRPKALLTSLASAIESWPDLVSLLSLLE
ncbi:hypothetical protein DXG01_009082 [Tephrocybe rancida]|nr:hypothetical protein DXG01_009082 [Tephrocybe rancida]